MVLGLVHKTIIASALGSASPSRNRYQFPAEHHQRRTLSKRRHHTTHGMEPKFGRYIKFNGCLIVLIVGFRVIVNAHQWVLRLQNWDEYPFAEAVEMRNHPVVDGVFQIMWIIAVTSFYQALWLEVGLLLFPIGFVLALETLIICAGDMMKRWNGDAEECFLRDGQVGVWYFAALVYFYYTLYILKKLFRSGDRKISTLPARSGSAQRHPINPLVRVH